MSPPLRSLRWILWPAFLLLAVLLALSLSSLIRRDPPGFLCFQVGLTSLLIAFHRWQQRWLWKFCARVRHFATVENARIVLHYEPELQRLPIISYLLHSCEKELDDLTRWFGSPLRGRVTVYLFAHSKEIAAIYRRPNCGGTIIWRANAIVIANDNCVEESMRHELVHLFASRWSALAPPLLSEGLAVCLQGKFFGQSIDCETLPVLRQGIPKLSKLLRWEYFYTEPQLRWCYVLAGSFTGFLIRRYGWERYRELYRSCNGYDFSAKFQKCFGISLKTAARMWRNEVMVKPILILKFGQHPYT
jgi:hypothetical protein